MNPHFSEYKFPFVKAQSLRRLFPRSVPPDGVDLVLSILRYNPSERPRAIEVLAHPFFDELRLQDTILPDRAPMPELFNWTQHEVDSASGELMAKLTPGWHAQ